MPTSVDTSWLISVSCMSTTRLAAAVEARKPARVSSRNETISPPIRATGSKLLTGARIQTSRSMLNRPGVPLRL